MISSTFAANSIRLARVTHVHPSGQKMEVIFLDNGDYGRDVQLMSPYAGADFGFTSGIPSPEEEGHDENMSNDTDRRTINVVVANLAGMHVALGFLYPQVTQMAFDKEAHKNRMIERHPSDFYRTLSDKGDLDMAHPSGVYLRIGKGTKPDALDSKDFDKKWKIEKNKDEKATVTIAGPNYTLSITHAGVVTLTTKEKVTVDAKGDMTFKSGGKITIQANSTIECSPKVEVSGDVTAGNGRVSLLQHVHTGVVPGGGMSGPPP